MPISPKGFKKVFPGLKWNRQTKQASIDVSAPGHKRRSRRVIVYDSVEDAKIAFAAIRTEMRTSRTEYAGGRVPTFGEYVAAHLEAMCARVKPATRRSYEGSLRIHLLPYFGSTKMTAIGELEIEEYVGSKLRRRDKGGKLAPASAAVINVTLRVLKKILRNARKRKVITDVPEMTFLPVAPVRNELSPAEQDAYLGAFNDAAGFERYLRTRSPNVPESRRFGGEAAAVFFDNFRAAKPWFVAALHSGLRRGDLIKLRWTDVNLHEGFLRVVMEKTTKEALIPISETLRAALLECAARPVVTEFVFVGAAGGCHGVGTIKRYHRIALAIAGIKRRVRIHDLRHSYGSTLASGNVSLTVIRDCMGHQSTKTTERYARPSQAAVAAVVSALDRPIRPSVPAARSTEVTPGVTPDAQNGERLTREQQPEMNKATVASGLQAFILEPMTGLEPVTC
jgi:hypothetical protein